MTKQEIIRKLLEVKGHVQTIKANPDRLDEVDSVVEAQYGIQDIMTELIDDLIVCTSKADRWDRRKIEESTYAVYIPELDRTTVWYDLNVCGEPIVTEMVGWYFGEPDEKATADFSKSSTTAYFTF